MHLAGITRNLTGAWCTQATRNLAMTLAVDRFRFLIRDNATVFVAAFDEIFTTNRARRDPHPTRSATRQRHRRTLRAHRPNRLLDRTLIWNEQQLRKLLGEYLDHYNDHRPHRGINQNSPTNIDHEPADPVPIDPIRRRRILDGLINEYHPAA